MKEQLKRKRNDFKAAKSEKKMKFNYVSKEIKGKGKRKIHFEASEFDLYTDIKR
jgi:chemotaxis receptor (MCP) glutamine deamidase CheD